MITILHPITPADHNRMLAVVNHLGFDEVKIENVKWANTGKFATYIDGRCHQTYQYGGYIWYLNHKGKLVITIPHRVHSHHRFQGHRSLVSNTTKYVSKLKNKLDNIQTTLKHRLLWEIVNDAYYTPAILIRLVIETNLNDIGSDGDALYQLKESFEKYATTEYIRWV